MDQSRSGSYLDPSGNAVAGTVICNGPDFITSAIFSVGPAWAPVSAGASIGIGLAVLGMTSAVSLGECG